MSLSVELFLWDTALTKTKHYELNKDLIIVELVYMTASDFKLVPESINTHTTHHRWINAHTSILYLLLGASWGPCLQAVLQDFLSGFPLPLPPQHRSSSCESNVKWKWYIKVLCGQRHWQDSRTLSEQDDYNMYQTKSSGKECDWKLWLIMRQFCPPHCVYFNPFPTGRFILY